MVFANPVTAKIRIAHRARVAHARAAMHPRLFELFEARQASTENAGDGAELAGGTAGATVCGDAERQRSGVAGAPLTGAEKPQAGR